MPLTISALTSQLPSKVIQVCVQKPAWAKHPWCFCCSTQALAKPDACSEAVRVTYFDVVGHGAHSQLKLSEVRCQTQNLCNLANLCSLEAHFLGPYR